MKDEDRTEGEKNLQRFLQEFCRVDKKGLTLLKATIRELRAFGAIKKHTYRGGWSGDYTTEYWKMNAKDTKLMDDMFKGRPIKAFCDQYKKG